MKAYTSKHARSSSTHLKMIFADFSSIKHGVKWCNFIYLHGNHIQHLCNFVHCGESQEVIILFLSHHQEGNASWVLVIWWVLCHNLLDLFIVFLSKLEWSFILILLGVSVVYKCTEGAMGLQERTKVSGLSWSICDTAAKVELFQCLHIWIILLIILLYFIY